MIVVFPGLSDSIEDFAKSFEIGLIWIEINFTIIKAEFLFMEQCSQNLGNSLQCGTHDVSKNANDYLEMRCLP